MESDLKLINECGFDSFEDVIKRINELVNIMRAGRSKAEINLQRFNNQAKEFLKLGQKDKAKKELAKKKRKDEKIKTFDTQFNVILEKLKEVKSSKEMLQVLNATKYCNGLLLAELKENEVGDVPTKEYEDLLENDKEITKYLEIILKVNKKTEKVKYNIPQSQNNNITNNEYLANIFNKKDFNNNQSQTQNIPSSEINIIKKCGFNSFDEVIIRLNTLINKIKLGRNIVENNLERFKNKAKEYLKLGQKDEAKKELAKKKVKEEEIKAFDAQLDSNLGKLKSINNLNQMKQVLNDIKYTNDLLLGELNQNELEGNPTETKEYQDLLNNDKEITGYLEIINGNNDKNQKYQEKEEYNFPQDGI